MHRRLPWYVPLMFVMTGAYLLIEVPFTFHLAGVLGGNPTEADIDRIEHFGRTLSGFAAAIAVLGAWHLPRMERLGASRLRACVTGAIVGSIAATATFLSLGWYADARAHFSDGQERKDALVAMLARKAAVSSGAVDHLGLELSQKNVFVAVMPEMLRPSDLVEFSGRELQSLALVAGDDARDALGTVSEAKSNFFENEFDSARDAYESYQSALRDVKSAYANADWQAENAWQDYVADMDQAFPRGWPTPPGIRASMVYRKVRFTHDIPVPEGWNLRNKSVFIAAVKKKISLEIAEQYQQEVELQLGKGVHLKPGLSFEQFVKVPQVQKRIRDYLPESGIPRNLVITPEMSDDAFEKAFYSPQVTKAIESMEEALAAAPSDFEYGQLASKGKDAVKASILPALALLMSLLGAVVHIYKFAGYGIQLVSHILRIRPLQIGIIRHAVVTASLAVLAVQWVGVSPAALATTPSERISLSGTYPALLNATVMVQPHLADLGDELRKAGAWDLVSAKLPMPKPIEASSSAVVRVASLELPNSVPIPRPRPVD